MGGFIKFIKGFFMRQGDLCHYYSSDEDHSVDIKPCKNCGVPVCASEECRTADGYCIECDDIRDDDIKLCLRADEMEEFYRKCHKLGI